ncbi:MAG: hypothetical protein R6V42_06830 [Orrella sp.]
MVEESSDTDPTWVENIRLNCRISVQLAVPLMGQVMPSLIIKSLRAAKSSASSNLPMAANSSFARSASPACSYWAALSSINTSARYRFLLSLLSTMGSLKLST